ncbi:MAG TPA: glycosyltransferase family 4 protein [Actinomycetota bacterium]|nr:glycosyltransferase family 4 protein [Actinomycetota bacterium]
MHVVHLSWEYPPLVYGGLGRHVHALAEAQAARGDRVTVVTQAAMPPRDPQPESAVEVLSVPPTGPFPYHLPSLHTWVGQLDHQIGRAAAGLGRADVVHAHDWVVGRAGRVASDALGVPLIATVHATEAGRHAGWLPDDVSRGVHLVEQWLVDEADEVIVCSHSMAGEVIRGHHVSGERLTVIPNGINAPAYRRSQPVPAGLLTGSPRLSFVGRLEWEKGVFTTVAAMPAVIERHPGTRLRMVGTGGQTENLRRAIRQAGLESHIELLGHVDETTLHAVYSSSDLVLAPSSYEPFGIVALEAAALGAPLVVGDTGGLAEFVTDERGRRCRPNDPADLARQILAALADPAGTQRRSRAAAAALHEYSWTRIAELTRAVYQRAARHPRPPRVIRAPPSPVWD